MDYRSRIGVLATIAVTLSFSHMPVQAQQTVLTQTYCSYTNLGEGTQSYDRFMTNGQCETNCGGQYALTIVQGNYCWCSDDVPADTVPVSECNDTCPGYPDEDCGNPAEGLFGYRQLAPPSATVGGGSGSTSKTSTSSTTPLSISTTSDPTTVVVTTTEEPTSTTPTSSTSSKDSPTPKPKPQSSSSSSVDESTTTKVTSTNVETMAGGSVTTHTIILTSKIPAPSEQSDASVSSSSGVSGGTIAGAVVGGLAGLAAIVGLAVFALLRSRRKQHEEYAGSDGGRESGVTRNTSVLSKTGLLGSGKSGTGSGEKPYLPPIHTNGRRSNNAFDMESASPSSDRRHSRPIFYDQRLNPSALMDNDNGSRASISTMQDNRDYTRTLNVRNPDPEVESIVEPDHDQQAQTR